MIGIKFNLTAGYKNHTFSIREKEVEVDVTKFLVEKLSATEEELFEMCEQFRGCAKMKKILELLKFPKVLKERMTQTYLATFFNKAAFPQFTGLNDEDFEIEISGVKVFAEIPQVPQEVSVSNIDTEADLSKEDEPAKDAE